ncbi:MAG TPA: hypothetical protein VJ783_10365 [Pirellulales bacterium]|nr:hypothetical protein [Pirellulales bacterium]
MNGSARRDTIIRLAIRNLAAEEVTVYLEPWGEELPMAPQGEYVLVGHGPENGSGFSVDYHERSIVVTGWTGSTVQVFSNGKEIGNVTWRPPVPDFDPPV